MSLNHLEPETRRVYRSLRPYDVVKVTWEDAYTTVCDISLEEAYNLAGTRSFIRKTLGFVVRADSEYCVVAGTDDRLAHKESPPSVADITVLCTGFVRDVYLFQRDKDAIN